MAPPNLSAGDRGDSVSALHKKLREAGYPVAQSELEAAFFGPTTRKAVLSCQRDNSLERSGAVCPQTAAALGLSVPEARGKSALAGLAPKEVQIPGVALESPGPLLRNRFHGILESVV
jgi:peptidoglycan hydrolase-like protein with peptidoglycan-binding domain